MCAFLGKYRKQAVKDMERLLSGRAADKVGRHAQYCDDQGRTFLALPGTTQGSTGLEDWWTLLDDVWFRAVRADPHGARTHARAERLQAFLAALHAVIVRHTAQHILALSKR